LEKYFEGKNLRDPSPGFRKMLAVFIIEGVGREIYGRISSQLNPNGNFIGI